MNKKNNITNLKEKIDTHQKNIENISNEIYKKGRINQVLTFYMHRHTQLILFGVIAFSSLLSLNLISGLIATGIGVLAQIMILGVSKVAQIKTEALLQSLKMDRANEKLELDECKQKLQKPEKVSSKSIRDTESYQAPRQYEGDETFSFLQSPRKNTQVKQYVKTRTIR